MSNLFRTKCVVLGDSTVGKTAITKMFLTDGRQYPKTYTMTCGTELHVKKVSVPDTNDAVEIFIYDSSGQDIYSNYLPKYWQKPNILIVVYDVTSKKSFKSINRWVSVFQDSVAEDSLQLTGAILFANKTDLPERRIVSAMDGEEAAEKLGLTYFEGSAKEYTGIEEPFFFLVHEWHKLKRQVKL